MSDFVMLVGVSYSGKSTMAEQLERIGYEVFSSDAIRRELWGDESNQRDPQIVFALLHTRIEEALARGANVVYDATNLRARDRKKYLNSLRQKFGNSFKAICVYYIVSEDLLKDRIKLRQREVPWEVVERQLKSYQIPTEIEGWDELYKMS